MNEKCGTKRTPGGGLSEEVRIGGFKNGVSKDNLKDLQI